MYNTSYEFNQYTRIVNEKRKEKNFQIANETYDFQQVYKNR